MTRLDKRREAGSFRSLYPENTLVDFSSNDYLGFAKRQVGGQSDLPAGSSGSRLISGNHKLYEEAEAVISTFHQAGTALIYNSGYDANIGLLSALLLRNDYVFYDQNVHASIRDGISLGKARAFKYKHNDLENLKEKVSAVLPSGIPNGAAVYVITESVFSMEGDGPDLGALVLYCKQNSFRLIVDEAHAAGILGPGGAGAVVSAGCEGIVFARVVTFGKALGCHGAAILGSALLRDYLINFSRSLIYTTALPPASLEAILKGYDHLKGSVGVSARAALQENIAYFQTCVADLGLLDYFIPALAAVHCCEIGGNARVRALADHLKEKGFDVKAILAPTVPRGHECLRFSLHAFNSTAQIREVLTILAEALKGDFNE
jgi:8-amino-7-oxononanoate synthase